MDTKLKKLDDIMSGLYWYEGIWYKEISGHMLYENYKIEPRLRNMYSTKEEFYREINKLVDILKLKDLLDNH